MTKVFFTVGEKLRELGFRCSQGSVLWSVLVFQELPTLVRAAHYPKNQKPHNYVGFKRLNGGRDWTRTSDPYRVKVVL